MNHTDTVQRFLMGAGRYPLLTSEQEIKLGRRVRRWQNVLESCKADDAAPLPSNWREIEKSGIVARDKLVNHNLRLVVSISKKYIHKQLAGSALEFSDLLQEGALGLMRGAEKFDPEQGCRFSTYAYWWIRQGITRAMSNDSRMIRLPIHLSEKFLKSRKYAREYAAENQGSYPSRQQLADFTFPNKSSEEALRAFNELISRFRDVGSLDLPRRGRDDQEDGTLADCIADPVDGWQTLEAMHIAAEAHDILSGLSQMEAFIVYKRLGEKETLQSVGAQTNYSRERVRQITSRVKRRVSANRTSLLAE